MQQRPSTTEPASLWPMSLLEKSSSETCTQNKARKQKSWNWTFFDIEVVEVRGPR